MKIDQMNKQVAFFLYGAAELARKKNTDYHPDGVAMLEILQTAFETGVTVEQDLWGRVRKQLSALRRFVIEGFLETEPPEQRMMDVAVYMAMMNFWVQNKRQCVTDAKDFVKTKRPCEQRTATNADCRWKTEWCDRCAFLDWLEKLERVA